MWHSSLFLLVGAFLWSIGDSNSASIMNSKTSNYRRGSSPNTNTYTTNIRNKLKGLLTAKTEEAALSSSSSSSSQSSIPPNMVTIFPPNSTIYDRYSAILAAVEPTRLTLESEIHKALPKRLQVYESFSTYGGVDSNNAEKIDSYRDKYPEIDDKVRLHELQTSRIVKSLGLTISVFNAISREVDNDRILRLKVLEQAYLYRISSNVNAPKFFTVNGGEGSSKRDRRRLSLFENQIEIERKKKKLVQFAKVVKLIEGLRVREKGILEKELGLDNKTNSKTNSSSSSDISTNLKICSPNIQPYMNSKVLLATLQFPVKAEKLLRDNSELNVKEFNDMISEMKRNPFFRMRVKRLMQNK